MDETWIEPLLRAQLRSRGLANRRGTLNLPFDAQFEVRRALAAVVAEVRVREVEDRMIALDYIPHDDDWRRVGLDLDVAAANVSGSGVSE